MLFGSPWIVAICFRCVLFFVLDLLKGCHIRRGRIIRCNSMICQCKRLFIAMLILEIWVFLLSQVILYVPASYSSPSSKSIGGYQSRV